MPNRTVSVEQIESTTRNDANAKWQSVLCMATAVNCDDNREYGSRAYPSHCEIPWTGTKEIFPSLGRRARAEEK